ncbi:hypothetical protein RvY_12801 [Ramazzottius varieornatus]|uniref:Uncharacterized protein n=1 Tax=Ramazzottius varieornatus TaxID=947166 RepID=A0A1D1VN08_RAMVA|nr:hypothetical protein RvY_12801 [Ramazzottius varieornatus]
MAGAGSGRNVALSASVLPPLFGDPPSAKQIDSLLHPGANRPESLKTQYPTILRNGCTWRKDDAVLSHSDALDLQDSREGENSLLWIRLPVEGNSPFSTVVVPLIDTPALWVHSSRTTRSYTCWGRTKRGQQSSMAVVRDDLGRFINFSKFSHKVKTSVIEPIRSLRLYMGWLRVFFLARQTDKSIEPMCCETCSLSQFSFAPFSFQVHA